MKNRKKIGRKSGGIILGFLFLVNKLYHFF
jgi:hypothetical protein